MPHDHEHEEKERAHGSCCHGGESCEASKAHQTVALNPKANREQLTKLRVTGMDCPDEIAAIERVLKRLGGVSEIKVNLMAGDGDDCARSPKVNLASDK